MRILKILAVSAAAVVGLLIVVAVLVAYLIDPNDYKDYLTRYVEEQTGRTLTIDEDLQWSLFPWFAIETGGVTIGNDPQFGEEPFATVDSLSARVRVWPLLRGQIEIGTVVIDGIVLNLAVDAEGNGNWSDIAARATPSVPVPGAAEPAPGGGLDALRIEGIEIKNGRVLWRENGNDIRYILSDINLSTGAVRPDRPIELETSFALLDVASQLTLDLDLEAVGQIAAGPVRLSDIKATIGLEDTRQAERASGRVELASLALSDDGIVEATAANATARVVRPPFGPDSIDVGLRWDGARIDPAAQTATVSGLVTVLDGIEARWQVEAANLSEEPSVTGSVAVDSAQVAKLVELGAIVLPADVSAASLGSASGRADFTASLGTGSIDLTNMSARLLGFELRGGATADGAGALHAELTVPAFEPGDSLRALLSTYLPDSLNLDAVDSLALSGKIDRGSDGTMRIDGVNATIGPATVTGSVAMETPASGPRYTGSIRTSRIAGSFVSALAGDLLTESLGPSEIGTFALDTGFVYESTADRVELQGLKLEAFGLKGSGTASVANLTSSPTFSGRAELAPFRPREFLARFDQPVPETSDPTAFREARVATRFTIDGKHGQFRDLAVTLDGSRITGKLDVEDFTNPSYRFDLDADRIDVDRYLPPPAEEADDGERSAGDIELRAEPLEFLRLSGSARVGDLKLANLSFQEVSTDLEIGGGRAVLDSAHAKLYGGEFSGMFEVDTSGEQPAMRLKGQATSLALEPLIAALEGESALSGTGNFDLDLEGHGATVTESLNRASGNVSFALSDGAIQGFNLERTLCRVYNRSQNQPAPGRAPDATRYSLIRAAATVSDGIASSRELLAQTPSIDITGSGRFTLTEARLDYDMRAKLMRTIAIPNCSTMDRIINGSFPFTIEGPLDDPEILPDFGEYLRERARDEAEDRLRESLQDRLRNLR